MNEPANRLNREYSLWGNSTDLSLLTNLTHDDILKLQSGASSDKAEYILLNNLEPAWRHLSSLKSAQIDIVLDSASSLRAPPIKIDQSRQMLALSCTPISLWLIGCCLLPSAPRSSSIPRRSLGSSRTSCPPTSCKSSPYSLRQKTFSTSLHPTIPLS